MRSCAKGGSTMSKHLLDLGFQPFEVDNEVLHAKEFPNIGYTLCESINNTFTISTYPDGNITTRIDISHIEAVNVVFAKADQEISSFKSKLDGQIKELASANIN